VAFHIVLVLVIVYYIGNQISTKVGLDNGKIPLIQLLDYVKQVMASKVPQLFQVINCVRNDFNL